MKRVPEVEKNNRANRKRGNERTRKGEGRRRRSITLEKRPATWRTVTMMEKAWAQKGKGGRINQRPPAVGVGDFASGNWDLRVSNGSLAECQGLSMRWEGGGPGKSPN